MEPPLSSTSTRSLPKYMQPDDDLLDLIPTSRTRTRMRLSGSLSPQDQEGNGKERQAPSKRDRARTATSTGVTTGPRTKVDKACVYCKRSHMTCEVARPCQRCIKRGIPELCRDDPSGQRGRPKGSLNVRKASEKEKGTQSKPSHDTDGNLEKPPHLSSPHRERARSSGTAPSEGSQNHTEMDMEIHDSQHIGAAGQFGADIPLDETAMFPNLLQGSENGHPGELVNLGNDDWSSFGSQSRRYPTAQTSDHAGPLQQPWSKTNMHTYESGGRGCATVPTHASSNIAMQGIHISSGNEQHAHLGHSRRLTEGARDENNLQLHSDIPNGHSNGRRATDDLVWGLSDYHPNQHERSLAQVTELMATNAKLPSDDNLELLGWFTEPDTVGAAAAILPPAQAEFKVTTTTLHDPSLQQPPVQAASVWPQNSTVREPLDEDGDVPPPWNYTYSYAKINRYISKHWSKESIERATRVVSILRPYYLSIVHDRTDIELDAQTRTLQSITRRIEEATTAFSPCPTLIWRRTGEIVGANQLMADLLGIPKVKLTSNSTLPVYELLEEDSAVRMIEDYAQCCYQAMAPAIPREGFTTAINSRYTLDMANHIKLASPLYLRNLGLDASSCIAQAATIECATSMMTYMDAYGVPVVVVCSFTPLVKQGNVNNLERTQ